MLQRKETSFPFTKKKHGLKVCKGKNHSAELAVTFNRLETLEPRSTQTITTLWCLKMIFKKHEHGLKVNILVPYLRLIMTPTNPYQLLV